MIISEKELPTDMLEECITNCFDITKKDLYLRNLLSRVSLDFNYSFKEIEFGVCIPATTFIHAGYSSCFVLFCLSPFNLYLKNSPNPYDENNNLKPDIELKKGYAYIFKNFLLPSFTLNPINEKGYYIYIRKYI